MNTPQPRPRPLPRPTQTTRFFWDAAKEGKLALQFDPVARRYQFWPRAGSVRTGKRNLQWRIVSGKGTVYSFTVTHVPAAGFHDRVPYLVALVELDEKVRIMANLMNVAPDDVKIGMRVRVTFEKLADDISYFAFEPAEA